MRKIPRNLLLVALGISLLVNVLWFVRLRIKPAHTFTKPNAPEALVTRRAMPTSAISKSPNESTVRPSADEMFERSQRWRSVAKHTSLQLGSSSNGTFQARFGPLQVAELTLVTSEIVMEPNLIGKALDRFQKNSPHAPLSLRTKFMTLNLTYA